MNLSSRISTTGSDTATTVHVNVSLSVSGSDCTCNEGNTRPLRALPFALFVPIPDFSRWEQAGREMRWLNSIRWACWEPLKPRCLLLPCTASLLQNKHTRYMVPNKRPYNPLCAVR